MNTKPCPVCGGTGKSKDCVNTVDFGEFYFDCPTCHGSGTIRPTQDPRFLFWAGVMEVMECYDLWEKKGHKRIIDRLGRATFYAHKKCRAILQGQPRRTTATWRKPV